MLFASPASAAAWTQPGYLYRYFVWGVQFFISSRSDDCRHYGYHTIDKGTAAFHFAPGTPDAVPDVVEYRQDDTVRRVALSGICFARQALMRSSLSETTRFYAELFKRLRARLSVHLSLLKTPKAAKSLEFWDCAAVVSPACLSSCVPSSRLLARRFRSRAVLELENLALRHQLHVLRRQRPGRPRLFTIDRLLWVWLYRLWPRCLDTMVLVKPATVVQWHRQGFRLFWRWRSRSGRPSVDREVRDLIRQMSSANPLWGAPGSTASCSSSASRSAKPRSPSTWCEDEVRLRRPGAAFCAIRPPASLRSICSLWRPHRFGCST